MIGTYLEDNVEESINEGKEDEICLVDAVRLCCLVCHAVIIILGLFQTKVHIKYSTLLQGYKYKYIFRHVK